MSLLPGHALAQATSPYDYTVFHSWVNANMCLNDPGQNTDDGTHLVVAPYCNPDDPASNWSYGRNSDNTSNIIIVFNQYSTAFGNKCIDNLYGTEQPGNPIVIWDCNNGNTQNFDWEGGKIVYHANPTFCVGIDWPSTPGAPAVNIVLKPCAGNPPICYLPPTTTNANKATLERPTIVTQTEQITLLLAVMISGRWALVAQ